MKATRKWISEFFPIESGSLELADTLTLLGAEVEGVQEFDIPSGVVVGKIISIAPDPKRKKITWCQVDAGDPSKVMEVACGAPNTRPGLITALALPGTVLGGEFEVGIRKFGTRPSCGMLCSEQELELSDSHEGIMELPEEFVPGTPLREYLGLPDTILDIDVTPNRPDLLSVLGLARELAAAAGEKLELTKIAPPLTGPVSEQDVSLEVEDHELCPRYCARLIRGIKVSSSPWWLRRRLEACGVRSINNVVDATNYVMLELGQPLHAFDFSRLSQGRVVVRRARSGEKIITIDEGVHELEEGMLVIADALHPVAVAGVMGGKESEVGEETTDLFLESAHFEYGSIRRTSRALGLSSESSRRFERIVDPNLPPRALDRLTELILQLAGGQAAAGMLDSREEDFPAREIVLDPSWPSEIIGVDISEQETDKILDLLGITKISEGKTENIYRIPSWRPDLSRPADLVEEVARGFGYNRVPALLPERNLSVPPRDLKQDQLNLISGTLSSLGLDEVITYSFMSSRDLRQLSLPEEHPLLRSPRILNPVNKEQNLLRTSLIPGLFEVIRVNQAQGSDRIEVYESGIVFAEVTDQKRPQENSSLGIVLAPGKSTPYWGGDRRELDFFTLKGIIENLLEVLGISQAEFRPCRYAIYQPGQTASLEISGRSIGLLGAVYEPIRDAFSLAGPVYLAELDLNALLQASDLSRSYLPLEAYPAVERDIAVIVDKGVEYARIAKTIEKIRPEILEDFALFDVYQGPQISADKKSLAIRLHYRSSLGTLEYKTVNAVHEKLIEQLKQLVDCELR